MGDAGCDGLVMQSTLSRMDRTARVFSWRVVKIEGVLRRMLMPSEAATLRRGGMAAENTNDVPLIRYVIDVNSDSDELVLPVPGG